MNCDSIGFNKYKQDLAIELGEHTLITGVTQNAKKKAHSRLICSFKDLNYTPEEIVASYGYEKSKLANGIKNIIRVNRPDCTDIILWKDKDKGYKPFQIFKNKNKIFLDFETLNDKIFFNSHQSVGVGTTAGVSISTEYVVGETKTNQSIPTRQIYLPNHPFHHGQKLTFTKKGTAASLLVGNESLANNLFNLPDVTTDTSTVFVINKGPDYIGIQTAGGIQAGVGTLSEGLFFHGNGSDDFEYFFKTNKNQVTGNVDSVTTKVSLDVIGTGSTIHEIGRAHV